MDKSQLRRIARDYALAKVSRADYLRRRRDLLDGIVSGGIAIQRVAPEPPPPPRKPGAQRSAAAAQEERSRLSPIAVGIGVVIVGAVGWALWPSAPAPTPVPTSPMAEPATVPVRQISAARTLVETFLGLRDWDEPSVSSFRTAWRKLSVDEQTEAKGTPWFRRLSKAVREELKTQKALVEFDRSGNSIRTGIRLIALGELLGISNSLPEFSVPDEDAATATGQSAGGVNRPDPAPSRVGSAASPESADPSRSTRSARSESARSESVEGVSDTRATPGQELTGSQWLRQQPDEHVTLQLFALNQLEKVERLMGAHPTLDLKVVEFRGETPRYRVLFGAFGSANKAKTAYASLPGDIRRERPSPYVKVIGELKALYDGAREPPRKIADGHWLASQDGTHFTLQLFASGTKNNVDRLVAAHPALDLRIHTTTLASSRFRVLYGNFATEDEARRAGTKLPRAVIDDTGEPIVKSIAELQSLTGP